MNKYEVVCSIGWNHEILRTVEAIDEYHARKIVWNELSDSQKSNCESTEVFLVEEKKDKNFERYKVYDEALGRVGRGEITEEEWYKICFDVLGEIMEENREMYKRMKGTDHV
jgi:hypothetical protein